MRPAHGLFWHIPAGEVQHLGWRSVFGGKSLCLLVSDMRARNGDFVIVLQQALMPRYGRVIQPDGRMLAQLLSRT
jgi:hypothetical protein